MEFKDILAAIAVVLNGLPPAMLALTFGFAAFPTALGFVAGGIGMVATGQLAPISLQTESIVLAGKLGKDRNERLNIVFFTGVLMAILGIFGLLEATIAFIGDDILNAMMAGVGLILAKVGLDMAKENLLAGGLSLASALITYFITTDLIYTIVISVFLSSIVFIIANRGKENPNASKIDMSIEKLSPLKIKLNKNIIRSVLAVCTLQIGGNIAYATITADLAGSTANVDAVTVYSGIADAVSAFFGGGPVEAIISGTASAPNPQASGILLMVIMAAILFTRLVPKIAKYVPNQCIGGFLFVLGALVVFPSNAVTSIGGNPIVSALTIIVTSGTDPFIGMVTGVIARFVLGFI